MNFKETLNQLLNENAPPMMRGRSMPSRPRQMPGSGYGRPPIQPGIRPGTFAGAPEGMFRRPTPESMPQSQGTAMRPKPYADPSTQAAPSMRMPSTQQQGMGMQAPIGQEMGMSPSQVPFSRVGMMTQPSAVPTTPQMPFDMPQEQPLEFGGQPQLPDVSMTPEVQMQPPQAERMSAPRMPTSTQMMGGPSSQPVSTPDILKAMEPSMFANFMTNKAKSPAPTQSPQPQAQTQGQGQGMGMGMGGMRMGGMQMRANPMQSPNAPVSDVSQGQVMEPEYVPSELRMGDSGEFDYNAPSQYAMSQNRYMSPEDHMRRRKAYFRESLESSLKKKNK